MSEQKVPVVPKFRAWDSIKQVVVVEQEFVTSTPDYVFVDHLIVMQSTGLLDNNGREIFEGDILKGENGNFAIHRHPTLGFYIIDSNNNECFIADGIDVGVKEWNENLKYISEVFEVIGNVYENPELLGQ